MDMLKQSIKNRPQRLCIKCGKCCRFVPVEKTYSELKLLAENGDKNAMDFLEMFVPYQSIDEILKLDRDTVESFTDWQTKTFYKCKYLNEDNLCSIYDTRFEMCRNYPQSPFLELPEGCGFSGWAFQEGEKIKHALRKLKEELLNYQTEFNLAKTSNDKKVYDKLIRLTQAKIAKFDEFDLNV